MNFVHVYNKAKKGLRILVMCRTWRCFGRMLSVTFLEWPEKNKEAVS